MVESTQTQEVTQTDEQVKLAEEEEKKKNDEKVKMWKESQENKDKFGVFDRQIRI